MLDIYNPQKILEIRKQIEEKHRQSHEVSEAAISQINLQDLVDRIVNMDSNGLQRFSYGLSNTELCALSRYIFINQQQIDLTNVYIVLTNRMTSLIMERIYRNWQNCYNRVEGSSIFSYLDSNEEMRGYFYKLSKMQLSELANHIQESSVLTYIYGLLRTKPIRTLPEYCKRMDVFAISKDSLLGKKLIEFYYCYCEKEEYLRLKEDGVYSLLSSTKEGVQKRVLINMLDKMDANDLSTYTKILLFYYQKTKDYGSITFSAYFGNISEEIQKKYRGWLNRYLLSKTFINDVNPDRQEFWQKYVTRFDAAFDEDKDAVFMDFGMFTVIEFRKMGPIYWFSDEIFSKKVLVEGRNRNESAWKSWLFNESKYINRKVHNGYWQGDARYITNNLLGRA